MGLRLVAWESFTFSLLRKERKKLYCGHNILEQHKITQEPFS
jgi:hypothetical protein